MKYLAKDTKTVENGDGSADFLSSDEERKVKKTLGQQMLELILRLPYRDTVDRENRKRVTGGAIPPSRP